MAWTTFKLGRPGSEVDFECAPEGMDISDGPLDVARRNLAGDFRRSIVKVSVPIIRVNSSYLTLTQRNQFASLANVADTHLSFKTRDDWQMVLERNIPLTVSTVIIQNSSATKLSAALVAAGATTSVTIAGVYDNAAGTGTNYYTGGSYDSATRTVTLGSPLASATNPVYVTYTYTGWLVMLRRLNHAVKGGWSDRFTYDFELQGV